MGRLRAYVRQEPLEALWLFLMSLGFLDLGALVLIA